MKNIKRIVLTGAESTGKTTLARQLADYYHTNYVAEYAREYVENLDRQYVYEDIEAIAKKQIELENESIHKANRYLFLDTALIILKVWFLHKYKKVPDWLLQNIKNSKYDLFLLCETDIPWIEESIRENQELRKYLSGLYMQELKNYKFPYFIITGKGQNRTQNAIKHIDQYFGRN